jgi:predicted Ser/Thr protein kinase
LLRVKVAIQLGQLDAAGAVEGLKYADASGDPNGLLDFLAKERSFAPDAVARVDRHAQRCQAIKAESVYLRYLRSRQVVDEAQLQPIMWEVRNAKNGPTLGETLVQRSLLGADVHAEIKGQVDAALEQESTTTAARYRERDYVGVERVSPVIAQLIQEEAAAAAAVPAPPPPASVLSPPPPAPVPVAPGGAVMGEGTMVLSEEHASGTIALPGTLGGTGSGDTDRRKPLVVDGEATDDSIPAPEDVPLPPQLANSGLEEKYVVLRKLGEGGMGVVFLAYAKEDVHRETPMALKVVLDPTKGADASKRFKREILATSMCGHPNIIEIFDASETQDGSYYMAMEYLEGEELSDILKRERMIDLKRVVTLMEQALSAMDAMHQANIVHRDIKPHNFRITRDENGEELLKVVDFGIARILDIDSAGLGDQVFTTMAGKITGSPAYIAPESITEPNVDARADLYSLGITIFRIASGRLPFRSSPTRRRSSRTWSASCSRRSPASASKRPARPSSSCARRCGPRSSTPSPTPPPRSSSTTPTPSRTSGSAWRTPTEGSASPSPKW